MSGRANWRGRKICPKGSRPSRLAGQPQDSQLGQVEHQSHHHYHQHHYYYHHYLIFQQVEHHHHQNHRLLISLAKKQSFHFSDFATTAVFDIIVSGVAAN